MTLSLLTPWADSGIAKLRGVTTSARYFDSAHAYTTLKPLPNSMTAANQERRKKLQKSWKTEQQKWNVSCTLQLFARVLFQIWATHFSFQAAGVCGKGKEKTLTRRRIGICGRAGGQNEMSHHPSTSSGVVAGNSDIFESSCFRVQKHKHHRRKQFWQSFLPRMLKGAKQQVKSESIAGPSTLPWKRWNAKGKGE